MRHGKKNRKFGRETKPRRALMRSLAVALIEHGRIETTQAKAKSLRPLIEKLITKSKTANLAVIRYLGTRLGEKPAIKMVKEIGPRFADRNGGYTRIRHLAPRSSDGAQMALIELVD